jgi:methylation protein EvaC
MESFMSLGRMPTANGFLRKDEFAKEVFSDLQVGFCSQCTMVQLTKVAEPEKLFHENYAYFSSASAGMVSHFGDFARRVYDQFLDGDDPFVVEIGSNDGIMLQNFAQMGVRHLGVDPSQNVAQQAAERGVATICSFFNHQTASDILRENGPADLIFGANVISHIRDIRSVMSGVSLLLKEDGVFIVESPYLGDILRMTSYEQFYDEHVFYFGLASLSNLVNRHGMTVVDVEAQDVHGGSMRYVIAREGARLIQRSVARLQEQELALGLTQESTFLAMKERIHSSREQLRALLKSLRREGKRIVGYGATAKSTILTNFCGIGPDLLEYISDTTPTKQGKYSPGMHIPVVPYQRFAEAYPDYALLLAWNHGEEVMAKEQDFRDQGGRFIVYIPEIKILD